MLERIKQADTTLFLWLNSMHTPFWDQIMYWVTDRFFWFPFYALLLLFLGKRYRMQAIGMVSVIILTIVVADKIASGVFKPVFARLRPCYEPAIQPFVHLVRGCGGEYGFVSSHASTTFGMALCLWLLLRKEYTNIGYLFLWAFVVSYSRIYVGVHYPLDLLVGALVGIITALVLMYSYRLLLKKYPRLSL